MTDKVNACETILRRYANTKCGCCPQIEDHCLKDMNDPWSMIAKLFINQRINLVLVYFGESEDELDQAKSLVKKIVKLSEGRFVQN